MDDKELLKRMMLAYVCLEELEIVHNGYFEEKLSRLAYELEATMIDRFSSRPVFDEKWILFNPDMKGISANSNNVFWANDYDCESNLTNSQCLYQRLLFVLPDLCFVGDPLLFKKNFEVARNH